MRGVPAAVYAVCAGLVFLLVACSSGNADPRAFQGTDSDESLEKLLESYELTLPPCEVEGLRFTGRSREVAKHLLLQFRAPEDCVNTYLDSHHVDRKLFNTWPSPPTVLDGKKLTTTSPPFSDDAMEKFDLKLDPRKTYKLYTNFYTPADARFTALVVPQDDRGQTVYMVSTYNGED
ncbi:hypothetical protein ACIG8K_04800 [Streptomyces halstedii]|uniref:Lipoprotein n=1 Tax=Streptomyces halstedii TaxID=1944 RepID=A0A6N9U3J9_STRHA|nr:hypothetical protein [Streptomyces halstedii]NEA16506.1 hypothetical protein [Streptomyces halstedii]